MVNADGQRDLSLNDAAAQFSRAALQALHVDDLAQHIPTVRSALAAAHAVGSVRDHLLLNKIAIFLRAFSSVPAAERRSMTERLRDDPGFRQDVGEYVIELLDHLEGSRQPAMVGAVFAAYAFQQIDAKNLRRLNAAIKNIPSTEIEALREAEAAVVPADPVAMLALSNAGLAQAQLRDGALSYAVNATGRLFLELELDKIRPSEA